MEQIELNRIYYEREKKEKELNDLMDDVLSNMSVEEIEIYEEEDRLYLKSLKQELTDEEDCNMSGGLRWKLDINK
jgi:hypothetical protein